MHTSNTNWLILRQAGSRRLRTGGASQPSPGKTRIQAANIKITPRFVSLLVAFAVVALLAVADAQEAQKTKDEHVFTDDQGRRITATVVNIKRGEVELRRDPADSETFHFPIAKLSAGDRAYLKQWFKEHGMFELKFRVFASESSLKNPGLYLDPPNQKNIQMSWDRCRYGIEIRNTSLLDLENATLEYRALIKRTESHKEHNKTPGSADLPYVVRWEISIPDLPAGKTVKVKTLPFDLFDRRWEEEKLGFDVDSKGSQVAVTLTSEFRTRHQLRGVELTVKINGRVVARYQTEKRSAKRLYWNIAATYSPGSFTQSRY